MAKQRRRCFYFDKNGDPIEGGCPKPTSICAFYHPEEEGWEAARIPTYFRAPKKRQSTRRSPTPPPPAHGYRHDSGYSRHKRAYSRSRSRSPARYTRHDSIASSVPEEAGSSRNSRTSHTTSDTRRMSLNDIKGPQSSTSSAIPRPTSPKKQHRTSSPLNSTASLPTPPVTALKIGGSFGDVPLPLPEHHPSMTTSTRTIPTHPRALVSGSSRSVLSHSPSSSLRINSFALPAPPKGPVPVNPPQPLPAVPPALSAELAPPRTVEPTEEEKRAMWEERTRILSESELAREQLATLEEQYAIALKIIKSHFISNLPEEEEEKIRLKDQFVELEKQRDKAKKTHEESMEKLFKTGSWPVAPPNPIEDGVEEKHSELVKYIQELKDTALQMSKILGDISMFKPPPLFLPADSDDSDAAAMDVDQPDGDNARRKSRKRRRISENMDVGSAPAMPTQEELDEFLERLVQMEGLISTLQNDINEHGQEAREEFELFMDTKLDEFEAAKETEEKQREGEHQQQMQSLEDEITLTGEQVTELADEIGELITRVGRLEVDVGASRKERQESFEKVLEVERRLQEYIAAREANMNVIQTFEKALNAYTSRPPSPPATPLAALPSFDWILQSVEEPMVQALRSHLVPAMEDLRKDVEDMVRAQNAELYSTLWNKITVTLKVLEMIQSKINQGDIEPVQTLAESVVRL